jgi:DNA-binding NarL/FixJ family response regulator
MTRIAIVEDHPAVAEGLAALLGTAGLDVVGVAGTADVADAMIRRERPDVVLCDIMLDGTDAGFDLLERLRGETRFVMLSAYDYPAHHARAIEAGACGYLSKMTDATQLAATIHAVGAGRTVFGRGVVESAAKAPRRPTPREHEMLTLLSIGRTNDEIAAALGIATKTVEGMLRRLFDRYDVVNRTQLLHLANRQGWLTSDQR